jgi:hypothetical protein
MQPDSSTLQQLKELPLAAMEALLESDDLQVVSENTALAAVSYWLQQEGRKDWLTTEQVQGLAFKLRLCNCTLWYLTGHLMDTEGWLHGTLTHKQRTMVLACVRDPGALDCFIREDEESSKELLFGGHGDAFNDVRWWDTARRFKIRPAPFVFKRTLEEIWGAGDTGVFLGEHFSNGLVFELDVGIVSFKGNTEKEVCIDFTHKHQHAPVAFSTYLQLASSEGEHSLGDGTFGFVRLHTCSRTHRWTLPATKDVSFTSLADATTALQQYICPDGKLLIKAGITVQ